VDWGNVAAGAITGVVGLAGIIGTSWQGKRSREAQATDLKASLDATAANLKPGIDAENERARLADKRRVYARYLAALSELLRAMGLVQAVGADNLTAVGAELDASTALISALSEVELIAPYEVGILAGFARKVLADYDPDDQNPFDYGNARANLIWAMRADLGESGPEEENGPGPDQGQPR
jgi:hypothetical protein